MEKTGNISSIDEIFKYCLLPLPCMRLDSRAQISIELLIVFAAVAAFVLLLVTQLGETGKEGSNAIKQKTKTIFEEIDKIAQTP